MHDTKYASTDGPLVGRLVEGLRQMYADDHALLDHGVQLFETLARGILTG